MFATKLREYEETLMTRGRVEGRAEGIAQGITQGRAEGRLETAQRMLADEMPLDSIARYTELSREEIIALRDTKG